MAVYKRGDTYWYEFQFNGERIQESAQTSNKEVAKQIEAAHRVRLAKGEVGILERPAAPTFKEFAPRFEQAIETLNADKPLTVAFYKERMRRLMGYAPLTTRTLDAIDEELIEALKRKRSNQVSRLGRPLSVASINRELATLRRLLHLAHEWKLINRIPKIRMFRGEVNREFVLSYEQEELYLHMAPQPLKDVALLILDTGARPGEACALEWRYVRLTPAAGARFGYIHIPGGKSKNAKRNLTLTPRVAEMLRDRKLTRGGDETFVFPDKAGTGSFLVSSLDHQHNEFCRVLGWDAEFVIHSLRHTMLTRLGESGTDAFHIMKIAGHSSVTVSQRYVHPSRESQETAIERMDAMNRSRRGEGDLVPAKVPTPQARAEGQNSAKPFVVNNKGA
jgi:integrase